MTPAETALLVISIVSGILAIIGTIFGIIGLKTYIEIRMKHKAEKKNKQEDELEASKQRANNEALMKLINDALDSRFKPVEAQLTNITCNLSLNTEGTVTLLRNDMKKGLDFYKDTKGFATSSDKASWMELYNTYEKLGGNHFKEYVNGWKKELEDLPLEKKKQKRQRLVEKR